MTALDTFQSVEGELEQTRWASGKAYSEDAGERRAYFGRAAQTANDLSGGTVAIHPETPLPEIDNWYATVMGTQDGIAGRHYAANKREIVREIPDDRLASLILEMHHEPTPTRRTVRNGKIDVINKYTGIKRMNHAYDNDERVQTPAGEVKIGHRDLLAVARPYVEEGVAERLANPHATHAENVYVTDPDRQAILAGLLGILAVSEGSTRATTGMIERDRKAKYEAKFPDDANKARFVRDSLARWNTDEAQARGYVRQALGITLN